MPPYLRINIGKYGNVRDEIPSKFEELPDKSIYSMN
jgi:hypothetical protein